MTDASGRPGGVARSIIGGSLIIVGAVLPYLVFLIFARFGLSLLGWDQDAQFFGFWLCILIGVNLYRWAKPSSRLQKKRSFSFIWLTLKFLLIAAVLDLGNDNSAASSVVLFVWYCLWLRWHFKLTKPTNKSAENALETVAAA